MQQSAGWYLSLDSFVAFYIYLWLGVAIFDLYVHLALVLRRRECMQGILAARSALCKALVWIVMAQLNRANV